MMRPPGNGAPEGARFTHEIALGEDKQAIVIVTTAAVGVKLFSRTMIVIPKEQVPAFLARLQAAAAGLSSLVSPLVKG